MNKEAQPSIESADMSLLHQEHTLQEDILKSLLPSKHEEIVDLEKAAGDMLRRRSSVLSREEIDKASLGEEDVENEWNINISTNVVDEGRFALAIKELSARGEEVLQVAACLASFDTRLLQASTSLSEEHLLKYLRKAAEKGIVEEDSTGLYGFSSDDARKEMYASIPPDKRSRFHAAIGRNLVRRLAHDELEIHISKILSQFHRGLKDIDQSERNAVAVLCLHAVRWSVSASDFRGACNYSDFGIHLLTQDCWKGEYTLSLALHNAAAEVFQSVGNYPRTDLLVSTVLKHARCYQDTLQIRATHIFSLSSQYKMVESLEEALDVLKHLGEKFPSKPRLYHVVFEIHRTRQLVRSKTNETILRIPLMENAEKIAALQVLNLIFPVAYRTDPMLNALFSSRMIQLTMTYGLNAISTVAFASFASMLASFYTNKEDAYRCSELAMTLLERFDTKEYIPRLFVFVYAEVLPYKRSLKDLCPFLLKAYHIGCETGDIQFAMIAATVFEGYIFFSGGSMAPIEEETSGFCKVATSLKQETALCLLRPDLKFLHILMGKIERPAHTEMLSSDLAIAVEARDKTSASIIHFLRLLLSYIFADFEAAAIEAKEMEGVLRLPIVHPGFSCLLTFHGLALLSVAPCRHGIVRWRLLSAVKQSIKLLETFSLSVPKNCLHSLNLVQAELAAVNGQDDLARGKYVIAIAVAINFHDLMIHSIASERFASFLRDQGEEAEAFEILREAYLTYKMWGAISKVHQMEKDFPELLTSES